MSITKRRMAIVLAAVLVLAVITSVFSMTSIADETTRSDYSLKFNEGGFIHADIFSGYDKVYIVDVSSYQNSIDWKKVYDAGIDGVILRVGYTGYKYGVNSKDSCFETYYTGAKAAGLKVGAYYYGQPTSVSDAEAEAAYVLGILNGRAFDLPIAYDLEYATNDTGLTGRLYESNFSSSALTTVANSFCKKLANAGYDTMVYTNCTLLTQHMIQSSLNYPVWIARYNSFVDYTCSYKMWQFSCTSAVDGIKGNCDVSVLYIPKSTGGETETTTVSTASETTGTGETTTQPASDTTTTETTTTEPEATSAPDYFTMFLDFLLKMFQYAAQFIPKLIAMITG